MSKKPPAGKVTSSLPPQVEFKTDLGSVESPTHYVDKGATTELIDTIAHLNCCRGNAVKYIVRAGAKDPTKEIEDLLKAQEYLDYEIQRLRGLPISRTARSVAMNNAPE